MKPTTRFYIDAFLQNMKNVAFFLYLPVLVAKLGATPFQISLSNSLPPLFSAFSLAFITRQLPLTRKVYYTAGVLRQVAFLCMAVSPLLPHPLFFLLFFWAFNASFVMITSVQQPALIRHSVDEQFFPTLFSRTKVIAIVVTVVGSLSIGRFLDVYNHIFPLNFTVSMVVGAVATFTGMNIIAQLAPKEARKVKLHFVRPLKGLSKLLMAVTLANASVSIMNPVWTVYHVNIRHLTDVQIGLFGVASGLLSTVLMPWLRKGLERYGERSVIVGTCAVMAIVPLVYWMLPSYYWILCCQVVLGVAFSYYDVAQQTLAVTEAKRHEDELSFLSDYQLVQNLGNGIAPYISGILLSHLSIVSTFLSLGGLKVAIVAVVFILMTHRFPLAKRVVERTTG